MARWSVAMQAVLPLLLYMKCYIYGGYARSENNVFKSSLTLLKLFES